MATLMNCLDKMKIERCDICREFWTRKTVARAPYLGERGTALQMEEHKREFRAPKDKDNGLGKENSDHIDQLEKQEGLRQQHVDKMEAAFKEKE